MRKLILILLLTPCASFGQNDNNSSKIESKNLTELEKFSYSYGVLGASGAKAQGVESMDYQILARAFKDVLEGNKLELSQDESNQFLKTYFAKLTEKNKEANEEKATIIAAEGVAFLEENSKKKGITTTESGLQYEVLTKGNGASPTKDDKVIVHYTGTLIDGTVFDSSVDRGEPAIFGVTQVIKGWTEALQLMSVGDKFRLFIPSDLAFGQKGSGAVIAPNSTLIFEVELLKIN